MNYNYNTYAKKLNAEIKCPNLKEMLFGMSDLEADDIKGIGTINRLLTFGFAFAFIKWKNDSTKNFAFSHTSNSKRVFDAFTCIYNGENVGLDLIIYVLTEMQMDVITYGDRSYFYGIIASSSETLQIPSLRNLIKTWFQSAKHAEKNQDVLLSKLIGLCNTLPFIFDTSVSYKTEEGLSFSGIEFLFKKSSEPLNSCLILIKNDYGIYYLSSYENIHENNAKLVYYSLDGVQSCNEILPIRLFLRLAMIRNHNSRPTSIFAKSLFSMSFKYIKNLSLSLSDTITMATKQKLYEHFSLKYSDVFELGFKKSNELLWDNIITILMIEEGPTELLEFILDSDGFYFEKILENLEMRYNAGGFAHQIKSEYDAAQSKELSILKNYIDDNSSIIKNISAINKTLMAKGIIDGLASLENNKKKSGALFVESLPVRMKNIDKIISSGDSNRSKVLKINKSLEKTFRYLIPFYNGVIAYQQEKEEQLTEIESKDKDLDFIHKEAVFIKCESKFFDAVEKSIADIHRKSLGQLVADFRALCKSVAAVKGRKIELLPKGRLLKSAIGREYICSLDTFENLLSIKLDDSMELDSASVPSDIISYINNEKHDKTNNAVYANVVLYNKFLLKVKQLFYFLIYNEDFEREMILGQQISFDPIYPYVVRYSTKSENRDGYNISSFSVFVSDDDTSSEVKILSERDYDINEKYYCIPNESTSNSRWWIEPFLISCRKYDQLIYSYLSGEGKRGETDGVEEEK